VVISVRQAVAGGRSGPWSVTALRGSACLGPLTPRGASAAGWSTVQHQRLASGATFMWPVVSPAGLVNRPAGSSPAANWLCIGRCAARGVVGTLYRSAWARFSDSGGYETLREAESAHSAMSFAAIVGFQVKSSRWSVGVVEGMPEVSRTMRPHNRRAATPVGNGPRRESCDVNRSTARAPPACCALDILGRRRTRARR